MAHERGAQLGRAEVALGGGLDVGRGHRVDHGELLFLGCSPGRGRGSSAAARYACAMESLAIEHVAALYHRPALLQLAGLDTLGG